MVGNENVADKNIEKDVIRLFGPLFSNTPMDYRTKDDIELEIYDIPTQFFIFNEINTAVYSKMSEELFQVVQKVIKDNSLEGLNSDNISMEHITNFRRMFWKHPEIEEKIRELSSKYEGTTEIELLNTFFKEMVRLSVYDDEQLVVLREFRIFIAKKSIAYEGDVSEDLKTDLFYFLDFGRFNTDDYVKNKANETLNIICKKIEDKECPDIRYFKSYNDWDAVPNEIVSMIEKLVLVKYGDQQEQKVVNEIREAVELLNLDLLKEYMDFELRGWQKYAAIFESRENLAANCRRCVVVGSKIRLYDGTFQNADDLFLGQKLLSSNKKDNVVVTRLEKRKDITYKVKLNTGEELLLTGNHRLPTHKNYNNGEFDIQEDDYVFVSNLKKGDFIPTILGYKSFGQYFTYEESKLIGYLIGDGSLGSSGISITKYDKKYVDVIEKLINNVGLSSWYNEKSKVINIQKSELLMKKSGLYRCKSVDKKIPEQMFGECENNKRAIIEGLLNTDGYIQIKGGKKGKDGYNRKKSVCIEYSSISKELINGIHILLNDLGVINYYNKKLKKIRLSTIKTDNYEAYYLYITDLESLKLLFDNCDLGLKKNYDEAIISLRSEKVYVNSNIGTLPLCSIKEKKYDGYINTKDRQYYINGIRAPRYNYQRWKAKNFGVTQRLEYQWSQVMSIEKMYEEEVIDIETDGDHLYWIDSVLSHNSGKSRFMTYINIRQIFLPGQMCLYILPSKEDYSEQPVFYIEQMVENIKKKGVELPGFQFNAKQFRVVNKLFKSKIIFLSAQGSSKGKSFSANLVTLDEAGYIDDGNIYEQAYNSTADTKGRMRAVSTINVETPINRFFYKKVSLDGMEDSRVISVDIWNNPFMKDDEKRRKEIQYRDKNQAVWLADWMAIFVGGSDGFDISTFFQIDFVYDVVTFRGMRFNMVRNIDKYEKLMLFYDPAKNKDKAGLAMIGKIGNRCDVVMTGYIDIKNYYLQWEVIIDIIEYASKTKPCEFGIDLGKAGEAAFDRFENKKLSPYGILSTGGSEITKKTYRRWNVPASVMESNLNALISGGVVKGFSWLERIRNEFETYNLSKERKAGVDHHHDVLSALMNACFIWYERGLIGFDVKRKKEETKEIPVDAYGRPIKNTNTGNFNPNLMSRFLH